MTGGSVENYLKILAIYRKDGIMRVPEIRLALEAGNYPLYATYVHALKSASASIGAGSISEFARQLEVAAKQKDVLVLQQHTEIFLEEFTELLDNIGYISTVYDEERPKNAMSDDELCTMLAKLKEALEGMDAITADNLLNNLQASNQVSDVTDRIEQIAQHVLLCEYDEANAIIGIMINAHSH